MEGIVQILRQAAVEGTIKALRAKQRNQGKLRAKSLGRFGWAIQI